MGCAGGLSDLYGNDLSNPTGEIFPLKTGRLQ